MTVISLQQRRSSKKDIVGMNQLGSEGSVGITTLNSWLQFKQSSLTEAILNSVVVTVGALADSTSEAVVSP